MSAITNNFAQLNESKTAMNNILNIIQTHFKTVPFGCAKPLLFYNETFEDFIAYINEVIIYKSVGGLQPTTVVETPVARAPPIATRPILIISQHLTSTDIVKRIICLQMGADIDSIDFPKMETSLYIKKVMEVLAKIPVLIAYTPSMTETGFNTLVSKSIRNHHIDVVLTDCPYSSNDCQLATTLNNER